MRRKLLIIMCSFCLGALTGCGSKADSTDVSKDTVTTNQQVQEAEGTEAEAEEGNASEETAAATEEGNASEENAVETAVEKASENGVNAEQDADNDNAKNKEVKDNDR